MKNILYDTCYLPQSLQLRRLQRVMDAELSQRQRQILDAFYMQGKTQAQIAREFGLCRSTVCRTLHRAENRLRRFLCY